MMTVEAPMNGASARVSKWSAMSRPAGKNGATSVTRSGIDVYGVGDSLTHSERHDLVGVDDGHHERQKGGVVQRIARSNACGQPLVDCRVGTGSSCFTILAQVVSITALRGSTWPM